MNTGIQAISEI